MNDQHTNAADLVRKIADSPDEHLSEEEFDQLLDALHGELPPVVAPAGDDSPANSPAGHSTDQSQEKNDAVSGDDIGAIMVANLKKLSGEKHRKPATRGMDAIAAESLKKIASAQRSRLGKRSPASMPADQAGKTDRPIASDPEGANPDGAVICGTEGSAPAAPSISAALLSGRDVSRQARRLDDIMKMMSELVLIRNRLVSLAEGTDEQELVKAISNLDAVTSDLRNAVMQIRKQPVDNSCAQVPADRSGRVSD